MLTRSRFTFGVLLLALALPTQSALAQERQRARVLVVNVPDVNHADSGNAGVTAIRELAVAGRYDVDVCVDYGLFTDSYLAPYDAMVWVMAAPLTWTDSSKAAFEKYVRSGKGFIGLHVAGLTGISKTPWPWFDAYLGGILFKGHPARQTATVKIDPGAIAHPIMKGVSPSFSVFEEWYSWNQSPRGRPGVTVLAGLDESSYGAGNLAMGADHAFVWTNEQYGRMVYAGFGHEPAIYRDPNVRTLLQNAILWATERPAQAANTRRIIALAEPGQTIHQPFADAALRWLQETAPKEGFTVDYIRTTDPIDEAYLRAHDLFIQVNYPPYRWTPTAEAAFKKAMEQGTIGWVGFHHASLLGKFDGFEMSPFFHQFMGNIVFKSYIPDFATGTVRVEDSAHPVFKGLPRAFKIESDEWYTYDRSPRPDVHVLANVDETSYEPARTVKMGDHPVIWTNPHYKAKNVYFQFGHKADLFQSDAFKTLVLNAIRWASAR